MTDDAAVKGFARDTDLLISRKLIDAEIASLPQTRGLDGKFSQEAYAQFLPQQRLTDATVRRLFEGDLARRLMLSPVAGQCPRAGRGGDALCLDAARAAPRRTGVRRHRARSAPG